MRTPARFSLFCLALCVLFVPEYSFAQSVEVAAPYFVYVSTGSDGRIIEYEFDPARTDTTRWVRFIEGPGNNFRPSDMVVGPDGLLYITDPGAREIWRMTLDTEPAQFELIYSSRFSGGPVSPSAPEGPIFGPDGPDGADFEPIRDHDSLYFNTKSGGPNTHTGIWRISGISLIEFGSFDPSDPTTLPEQVITPVESGSTDGEGMAWTIDGRLLLVDRSNRRIEMFEELDVVGWISSSFAAGVAVLSTPGDPIGLAVNSNGDIFVSLESGDVLSYNRISGTLTYSGSPAAYHDAGGSLRGQHMEFDAADTLWLAAATGNGKAGELQRIVDGLEQESDSEPRTPFYGVALPVSAVLVRDQYVGGSVTFDLTNTEVKIDITSDSAACQVELTVEEFEPADLNFLIRANPEFFDSSCVRYAGYGGRCVLYRVSNFGCAGNEPYEILVKFFSGSITFPGLLHDVDSNGTFDEDILIDYLPLALPGDLPGDPAMRGRGGSFSDFVAVDRGRFVNRAPSADAGPDQTVEAAGIDTDVTLDGSASFDAEDEPVFLDYAWSWADGGIAGGISPEIQLPIGSTEVTLEVTDLGGLSDTDTVTIMVADTTAPVLVGVLEVPETEATGPDGASVTITVPTATDSAGAATVTGDAQPADFTIDETGDYTFPLDVTTITWTATDDSTNSVTGQTLVTVVDTTPPTITAPDSVTDEATSPQGVERAAMVPPLAPATATDIVDQSVDVTSDAPEFFAIAATTVTWTATDDSGNSAQTTSTVTVVDTTPPVLDEASVPTPVSVTATTALGAEVALATPTATDIASASVTVISDAPAIFPIGTTTVTWTATDDAGLIDTASTTVTVDDPSPVWVSLTASPSVLKPVNHKLKTVSLTLVVEEFVGYEARIVSVTANEPIDVNSGGDGKTTDDDAVFEVDPGTEKGVWVIGNPTKLTLRLRAERQGGGTGRIYTITVEVKDANNDGVTKTVDVLVN